MELSPKVFLAHERGLKAGFSVLPGEAHLPLPSPHLFLSFHFTLIYTSLSRPPSCVYILYIYRLPLASITIDYPHFRLRARNFATPDAAESAGYARRVIDHAGGERIAELITLETKPI